MRFWRKEEQKIGSAGSFWSAAACRRFGKREQAPALHKPVAAHRPSSRLRPRPTVLRIKHALDSRPPALADYAVAHVVLAFLEARTRRKMQIVRPIRSAPSFGVVRIAVSFIGPEHAQVSPERCGAWHRPSGTSSAVAMIGRSPVSNKNTHIDDPIRCQRACLPRPRHSISFS